MRPEAEAPLVAADEVGVVFRHPAVVHHLRAARVAASTPPRPPLPIVRSQRIANPQLPRRHSPAVRLEPLAATRWLMASTRVAR